MSRAFVKEPDGLETFEDLPEKLISEHRNLVTADGISAINDAVARLERELAEAQSANDRGQIARAARDLRYWAQRQATAEVMPPPADANSVQFASLVSLRRDDGRTVKYRIVGEDEADPAIGKLSYAAPLAQALLGKGVGDDVSAGASHFTIAKIS